MDSSGSHILAELLNRVPAESRALVGQLWDEPLLSSVVLRGEVDAHVHLFRDAQRNNPLLDVSQAEALAQQCRQLLDAVGDDAPEQARQLVQVAVRYFAIEDDLLMKPGTALRSLGIRPCVAYCGEHQGNHQHFHSCSHVFLAIPSRLLLRPRLRLQKHPDRSSILEKL